MSVSISPYWRRPPYWAGRLDGARLVLILLLLLPLLAWAVGLIGPQPAPLPPALPAITYPPPQIELTTTQGIRVTGFATPNTHVQVYDRDVLLGEVQSNAAGYWLLTLDQAWPASEYELEAIAIGPAEEVLARSQRITFTVRAVTPALPGLLRPPPGEIDYAPVELAGVATAGARVRVYSDDRFLGVAQAEPTGQWRLLLPGPLDEGAHEIQLEVVDVTGLVINRSDIERVTVLPDALVEEPPIRPVVILPSLEIPPDGRLAVEDTLALRGTAPPRRQVRVYADETLIAEATADNDGNWEATTGGLALGDHTLRAEVLRTDGLPLADSGPIAVEVFGEMPVVEAPGLDLPSEPRTPLPVGTVTLTGEAAPGARVQVFSNGELLGETVANPRGRWMLMLEEPLAQGEHTLQVVVVDAEGRPVADSPPTLVTVAEAPQPVILRPQSGARLLDSTPAVEGRAQPNQIVQLYVNDQVIGEARADADGDFRIVPIVPLRPGAYEFRVIALDETFQPVGASEQLPVIVAEDAVPSVVEPPELLPITGGDEPDDR